MGGFRHVQELHQYEKKVEVVKEVDEMRAVQLGRLWRTYRRYKVYIMRRRDWRLAGWGDEKILCVSSDILTLSPEYQKRILDHEIAEREFVIQNRSKLLQAAHESAYRQTGFPNNELMSWTERRFKRRLKERLIPW